jgi:cardiolipin synthase
MDTMLITVPNLLTLLRIIAVPCFAIMVWYGEMVEACALFVAAGLTDALDGYLARKFNQRSTLGAILDPAADKLLITTALVMLAFPREGLVARIPPWITILAISRDVVIATVALLAYDHLHPDKFKPSILGKLTTFVELTAISLSLLVNTVGPCAWYRFLVPWIYYLMAFMVVASGIHYFFRTTSLGPEHP